MPKAIAGTTGPLIHLQGLGPCSAKPASEFKVGDVTRWNYGFARDIDGYTVVEVEQASAKFVALHLRHNGSGTVYPPRRLKADRLVAYFREDGRR
jgi:hypothetical protein